MLFVAGYHGSGKSTIAEHLGSNHGYIHVERSSVLTSLKDQEDKEKPMRVWREEQKRQLGNYALEDMIVAEIRAQYAAATEQDDTRVVVTGNRALDEIKYTALELVDIDNSKPQILALKTNVYILFERYVRRARSGIDQSMTAEDFTNMLQREKDAGIEEIFDQADHTIYNSGSKLDLLQSVDTVLELNRN